MMKFLFSLFLVPHGYAEKPLVACTVHWPPRVTLDEKTQAFHGPDITIIQAVAKKIGKNIEIKNMPWKRCLALAEEGKIDLPFPASLNEDRQKYLHFVKTPLYAVGYSFAVLKDTSHKWGKEKNVSELPQPIGSVSGYTVTAELKALDNVKVDDSATNETANLQKLLAKRIKVALIYNAALGQAKETGKVTILDPAYAEPKEYFITVSKKTPNSESLTKKIQKALEEIKKEQPELFRLGL